MVFVLEMREWAFLKRIVFELNVNIHRTWSHGRSILYKKEKVICLRDDYCLGYFT